MSRRSRIVGLAAGGALLAAVALGAACDRRGRRAPRRGDAGPAVVLVDRASDGTLVAREEEPNDAPAAAQTIPLPGGVRGTIGAATAAGADEDVYAVEVPAAGAVRLRLSGVDDADLVLEIQDPAGKRLAVSDNGPARTVEGVPNLPVAPGGLRLVVREYVKKPRKGPPAPRAVASMPYELTVALAPAAAAGEETEPNDAAAFAGSVVVGGAATGYLGWRRDRDVWKVPLDGVGQDDALAVDVEPVPGVALLVSVLDGTEAVLLERQGPAGEAVALRNVAIRPGEPFYFVAVSGARGNPDERYTLRVSSAPFQLDEEAEPNDAPAVASPLADVPGADSGTRVGFLGPGDVDVFRLEPAPGARLLSASVEPPAAVDATLAILDGLGKPLVPAMNAGKRGGAERLERIPVPAGAQVYVKVAARAGGSASDRYRLRWSAPPDESVPVLGIDE